MAVEKECFKCQKRLPLSEFYRHADMADGHLNKCKPCARSDVQVNREAKRDYYNEYDRNRQRVPPPRVRERHLAHVAVSNALRRGKLVRQPCTVCGDPMTQGHHRDYSRRLDVVWLCRKHHGEAHRIESPLPSLVNIALSPSRGL